MNSSDVFFYNSNTKIDLTGQPDIIAKFIQEFQLKNTNLWTVFVRQFRDHTDSDGHSWKGEFWGKMMRGACITWEYTQDDELYEILKTTVQDLISTQDSLGRISTYSIDSEFHGWDLWCRKYVLLGLLHFSEICKDHSLKVQVLDSAKKHMDYLIQFIGDGKIDITSTSEYWRGINSSSILEPVVRMYQATNEKRYLDFAEYIIRRGGSSIDNIFELAVEDCLYPHEYPVIKAYELMSCFEGLLEYYKVTGEEKWKNAVCNFADKIQEAELSIIGCAGSMHEFFDHAAINQTSYFYHGIMQETCVTVTWMKLCERLLRLTGNPIYADQMEKSAYNALYGSVNLYKNPYNGALPFDSYSPLTASRRARGIGGYQSMEDGNFFYGCCAAIGSAGTGLFPRAHLLHSASGPVLNFYTKGTIIFLTPKGQQATLKVETEYPADGRVHLTLTVPKVEVFDFKMRIPHYCRFAAYYDAGNSYANLESGYFRVHRLWEGSFEMNLDLDMNPRTLSEPSTLNQMHGTSHFAVCYGPLVLARDKRLDDRVGEREDYDPSHFEIRKSDSFGIDSQVSFLVQSAPGTVLKMIDYASAGATWDERSEMECWILQSLSLYKV